MMDKKKKYAFSFFPTKVHRFSGNRFVLLYLEIKLDIQRKGNSFLYESKKKFWSDKTNKRKPNSVMFFVYFNSSKKKLLLNIFIYFCSFLVVVVVRGGDTCRLDY